MKWLTSFWNSLFQAKVPGAPRAAGLRSHFQFLNIPKESFLLESKEHPWVVVVSIEPRKRVTR